MTVSDPTRYNLVKNIVRGRQGQSDLGTCHTVLEFQSKIAEKLVKAAAPVRKMEEDLRLMSRLEVKALERSSTEVANSHRRLSGGGNRIERYVQTYKRKKDDDNVWRRHLLTEKCQQRGEDQTPNQISGKTNDERSTNRSPLNEKKTKGRSN